MDFMTTFGLGNLSRSFTIKYLLVVAHTSYFDLIGIKTLNKLMTLDVGSQIRALTVYQPSLGSEFDIDP